MSAGKRFLDTNVLLYMLSADTLKAERSESEMSNGGVVSVQVLNEFAAVASRKLKMAMAEIREILATVRVVCEIVPITEETHDTGLHIAEKYGLSVYDAMIVATALLAGCKVVLSEDMQDGQVLEGKLRVRNPFR